MEDWVPLFVAVVGAMAAIGVAFWNSRGDFAELRQLKSMNEVLPSMPEGHEKMIFEAARDSLAVRVATRVATAPSRRRLVWIIVVAILGASVIAAAAVLLSPYVPTWFAQADVASWVAVLLGAGTLAVITASFRAVSLARLEKERARARASLRAAERWLGSVAKENPGGGRSA